MRIREIQLRNFKRFTDTTITGIPEAARLVMIVGPNGCGKSSVIDAAQLWQRHYYARSGNYDETYHRKQIPGVIDTWNQLVVVEFHNPPNSEDEQRKAIYARSAYRNEPDFQLNNLTQMNPAVQEHRINRLIDNDQAVSLNYQRLVSQGFQDLYETEDPESTIGEFRERSIGDIRAAMTRLFPDLILNSLGNPLNLGDFQIRQGRQHGVSLQESVWRREGCF